VKKNYNYKRKDNKEKVQQEDERKPTDQDFLNYESSRFHG
jgi:hypothetical protein